MQSTEKRIAALETVKAKGRPWEHLTDNELSERIELYRTRAAAGNAATERDDDAKP